MQVAKAKEAFFAMMSHELRTPMNAIIATCDLLRETQLTPVQDDHLATISVAGDTLLSIINDVLDFSKLEAGKFEFAKHPFSLHDCVENVAKVLTPLAEKKGLKLSYSLPSDVPQIVLGDEKRLRQALLNLAGNAIKFTSEGSVELTVTGDIRQGAFYGIISIVDTGIGIPPDRIDHIFDPFTQADASISRQFGGTGLGLSIVQKMVRAMGGNITVRSAVDTGSTFQIDMCFPISSEPAGIQTTAALAPLPPNLQALVADDNRTNRKLLRSMLEPMGVIITEASNGVEAVAAFVDARPDVVLMDMSMPELNGLEAATAIRQYEEHSGAPRCPIIALTANAFSQDRQNCLEAGMDDHLAKPIRKTSLVNLIAAHLTDAAHEQRSVS